MTTTSTTSSTMSPAATTPTKSAASVAKSATNALLTSLGSGSGIDTEALVNQLVEAQFASKKAQLTAKYDTLTAQISGASSLKNTISDFAKAVDGLVTGGTLATQPTSSNSLVATATVATGGTVSSTTSSTIKVNALATAQTATSSKIASPTTATFGTGTLTLKLGTATFTDGAMTGFTTGKNADNSDKSFAITIDSSNNTLSGVAAAINAQKAGVTATVVTDADGGAYLSLKGQTGAAQAFTLTASDPAGALATFDTGFGASPTGSKMTVAAQAANAKLEMDGVAIERASNDVSDLVPGVKLTLSGTGTTTVGATRPESALSNAIKDFVETYNGVLATVKEQTDPINGQLRADPAARTLLRTLQGLTSRPLLPNATAGSPSTLASIGVRTKKNGELEVDADALARAMKDTPEAVEAMLSPSALSSTGLNSAMKSLELNTSSAIYGLGKSSMTYTETQGTLAKQQSKLDDQATRMTTRMTQQFSSMNARVSAYKATQSFMQQQIDAWAKSSD